MFFSDQRQFWEGCHPEQLWRKTEENQGTQKPAVTVKPVTGTEQAPVKANASYTLTIGGSVSLSGEVRKNSWNADAKMTDYSDVMMLLAPHVKADVSCVFLENALSDQHKANDYVAPASAASLLKEAGFSMAACGFSQANDRDRKRTLCDY